MKRNRTHLQLAAGLLVLLISAPAFAQAPGAGDLRMGNAFAPVDLSTYGSRPEPNQGYFFSVNWLNWNFSEPRKSPIGSTVTRDVVLGTVQWDVATQFFLYPEFIENPQLFTERYNENTVIGTEFIDSDPQSGMRYEFGRISGHHGWMISTYHVRPDTQTAMFDNVPMTFDDPEGNLIGFIGNVTVVGIALQEIPVGYTGIYSFVNPETGEPIPDPEIRDADGELIGFYAWVPITGTFGILDNVSVVFDRVEARSRMKTWAVDAAYVYRSHRNHFRAPKYLKICRPLERVFDGSIFEWYVGGRYQEFDGRFNVLGFGGVLGDSYWNTRANNHIVGPMLGMRWSKQHARLTLAGEGRFIAGFNRQNFYQEGQLGSTITPGLPFQPDAWPGSSFTHKTHANEFSPIVEVRAELKYQVTRGLAVNAGWSGTWADNIARPTGVINYQLPTLGIDISGNRNRDTMFMHGLVIGAEINR